MNSIGKLLSITVVALTVGCSSGDSGSSRALSTQEAAMNKSVTALSSLGTLAASAHMPLMMRAQATSAFCDENGTPTVPYAADGEWAFAKFLCAGAHNTYSPDSALGALSLMKGIVCVASLQGVTYSATGDAITFTDAPLTSTCFPSEMVTKMANESQPVTSVSGTVTGFEMTGSGWDYRLEFTNMSPINDFTIYIRSSDDVTAAAFVSPSDSWSVSIDQRATPNRLIYEAANSNRHIRLLAEGVITAAGTVTSVTDMGGIVAEASGGEYVSLIGSESDGVRISYEKSGQGGEVTDDCYDVAQTGATCGSTTQLSFHAAQVAAFTDGTALTTIEGHLDNNPLMLTSGAFPINNNLAAAVSSDLR